MLIMLIIYRHKYRNNKQNRKWIKKFKTMEMNIPKNINITNKIYQFEIENLHVLYAKLFLSFH